MPFGTIFIPNQIQNGKNICEDYDIEYAPQKNNNNTILLCRFVVDRADYDQFSFSFRFCVV